LRIAAISMSMDRAARVLFFLVWGLLTVLLPSGRVAIVWVGITIFIAVCATTIVLRVLHIKRQLEQQGSDISDA
ncbi:MAG: hypothetical protein HKP58_13800, partial [Desulfatitalea sp.]|nr:hypothetical protein [Desulfatitalea sp.]NNK01476.1 hypothetical protein [Desulfatitalea sp.]